MMALEPSINLNISGQANSTKCGKIRHFNELIHKLLKWKFIMSTKLERRKLLFYLFEFLRIVGRERRNTGSRQTTRHTEVRGVGLGLLVYLY
jgi:hypothetical protein